MKKFFNALIEVLFYKLVLLNPFLNIPFLIFLLILAFCFFALKAKYGTDKKTLLLAEKKIIEIIEEKTQDDFVDVHELPDFGVKRVVRELWTSRKYFGYCLREAKNEIESQERKQVEK